MFSASSVLKALPRRAGDRAPAQPFQPSTRADPGLAAQEPPRRAPRDLARPSRIDEDLLLVALADIDLCVPWSPHPDAVGLALLDAVFTIRTTYGSPTTGVRGWVAAYAEQAGSDVDDLAALAAAHTLLHELADGGHVTRQRLMGGALKVDAAMAAAGALSDLPGQPRSASDLRSLLPDRYAEARDAFGSVEGLGVETFEYLLLLIGAPGRRATAAWTRLVTQALAREVTDDAASRLLDAAAGRLSLDEVQLVHAVWRHGKRA